MPVTVVAVPDRMTDFVDTFDVSSRALAALDPGFTLDLVVDRTYADGGSLFLVKNA